MDQSSPLSLTRGSAGQKVGVKQTAEHIWLVTFMEYDLGYFDDETCRLEPIDDPFGPGGQWALSYKLRAGDGPWLP